MVNEGLKGQPDQKVWDGAQAAGRLLITQDLDFSDIRRYAPRTHHGLLLVHLRQPGANALLEKVSAIAADIERWQGCFVVLTDHKIRIKRF